jgi:hypothetical protein
MDPLGPIGERGADIPDLEPDVVEDEEPVADDVHAHEELMAGRERRRMDREVIGRVALEGDLLPRQSRSKIFQPQAGAFAELGDRKGR